MKKLFYLFSFLFLLGACQMQSIFQVVSPNKNVLLNINVSDSGLVYSVSYQGKQFIMPSGFELSLKGQTDLKANLKVISTQQKEINETWQRVWIFFAKGNNFSYSTIFFSIFEFNQ